MLNHRLKALLVVLGASLRFRRLHGSLDCPGPHSELLTGASFRIVRLCRIALFDREPADAPRGRGGRATESEQTGAKRDDHLLMSYVQLVLLSREAI